MSGNEGQGRAASLPVEARPAASVILVREAAAGAPEPIETYLIRRHAGGAGLGFWVAAVRELFEESGKR